MFQRILDIFRGESNPSSSPSESSASFPKARSARSLDRSNSCGLIEALEWVEENNSDTWEGEREKVLALVSRIEACGPLIITRTPSPGFMAAADTGILQVMSFGAALIPTLLPYPNVEKILFAPEFTFTEGAVAFSGSVDGEEVPLSAIVAPDQAAVARRMVEHVSAATGVAVDVRSHG